MPKASTLPALITVKDFAKMTRIPLSTVYLMVARGDLRAVRYGGGRRQSLRIVEEDACRWFSEHLIRAEGR